MPANFHIRLIEPPAAAYRTLSTPELLLDLRGILDDPAVRGFGTVRYATLGSLGQGHGTVLAIPGPVVRGMLALRNQACTFV